MTLLRKLLESSKTEPLKLGEVSLEIGNGGASFEVQDTGESSATVLIKSAFFGNVDQTIKILTDPKSLEKIGNMFLEASRHQFRSEPYVHAATTGDDDSSTQQGEADH